MAFLDFIMGLFGYQRGGIVADRKPVLVGEHTKKELIITN